MLHNPMYCDNSLSELNGYANQIPQNKQKIIWPHTSQMHASNSTISLRSLSENNNHLYHLKKKQLDLHYL